MSQPSTDSDDSYFIRIHIFLNRKENDSSREIFCINILFHPLSVHIIRNTVLWLHQMIRLRQSQDIALIHFLAYTDLQQVWFHNDLQMSLSCGLLFHSVEKFYPIQIPALILLF